MTEHKSDPQAVDAETNSTKQRRSPATLAIKGLVIAFLIGLVMWVAVIVIGG